MTGADKVVCQAATLLLLFALTTMPAKAQFPGLGGGGAIPGNFGGGYGGGYGDSYGVNMGSMGGGNIMGMLGGAGGGEMMSMIPQLMRMANMGGGSRHGRRHRRR